MRRLFYMIIGLQIFFLVIQTLSLQAAFNRGRIVTLKVVPVDPRSLFMGNYMTLSYDISTIDLSRRNSIDYWENEKSFTEGQPIYVGLEQPTTGTAVPRFVTLSSPGRYNDRALVYLRGRISSRTGSIIGVDYGLDRYYIPEGRQKDVSELERGGGTHQITAEVAVKENGQGLIRRILVDGKPLPF